MSTQDKNNAWMPISLAIVLAIGMMLGYMMNEKGNPRFIRTVLDDDPTFGQVEELIRFVETRYVDTVSREELTEAAMNEVLSKLDPHSIYITPDEVKDVNDDMQGKFQGIGIELFYIDDTVNIVSVVDDGPAQKAGMKPFDKIIYINDSLVAGNDLEYKDIRKMMRGDAGKEVTLKVKRQNQSDLIALPITIGEVPVKSVGLAYMMDDKTAYFKVDKFNATTYREFMEYLEKFSKQGLKDIVIDLRNNPGGHLKEATNILSQLFEESERLLVYTQTRDGKKQEYETTGKPFFEVGKVAVLINENSASGSELLAGAIQDWDRGLVIGRRSFGKGLVQEQYDLSNGGALRLTVARYYTPSGRSIQKDYSDKEEYYKGDVNKVDSTIYYTKVLKRPVYGGGGITPDVIVGEYSDLSQEEYDILVELPKKVFTTMSRNPEITKNRVANDIIAQFNIQDKKIIPSIKEKIENLYEDYQKGSREAWKLSLSDDEYIQKAKDYFSGKIELK